LSPREGWILPLEFDDTFHDPAQDATWVATLWNHHQCPLTHCVDDEASLLAFRLQRLTNQ
jgi:hypothetical protein